jgi:hypothetical protein
VALGAASGAARAQRVPRADLPARGTARLTFDPRIEYWREEFVDGSRVALGAALTGDSVRATVALPDVARLQADIRTAGAFPGYVANLGRARLSVLAQRRVTPLLVEYGVTPRLAVGVLVPLVRTYVRSLLALDDTTGGDLGLNPLLADPTTRTTYDAFFTAFDGALDGLAADTLPGGALGCPGGAQCAAARAFLADARAVEAALRNSVYGPGTGGGAPLLPVAGSAGALAVDTNIARLQAELAGTWGQTGFTGTLLFPAAALDAAQLNRAVADSLLGWGARAFVNTPREERFWLGDVELAARYRIRDRGPWAATVGLVWRLPTGHQDSPNDPLDLAAGDGQTDIEAQLVQELTLWHRLWLNLSLRAGAQLAGERARRVAPPASFLVRRQLATTLAWDPGDYLAVDFAPLVRFHPRFAAGATAGWFTKGADRYTYRDAADSAAVASAVGAPVSAALLDAGTAVRSTRLGVAATYHGPVVETGFTAERTISGSGGRVPASWAYRLVMRVGVRLF